MIIRLHSLDEPDAIPNEACNHHPTCTNPSMKLIQSSVSHHGHVIFLLVDNVPQRCRATQASNLGSKFRRAFFGRSNNSSTVSKPDAFQPTSTLSVTSFDVYTLFFLSTIVCPEIAVRSRLQYSIPIWQTVMVTRSFRCIDLGSHQSHSHSKLLTVQKLSSSSDQFNEKRRSSGSP